MALIEVLYAWVPCLLSFDGSMVLLHFVTEVFWWFVLQIHVTLIGETNSKPACGASHAVPCTVGTSKSYALRFPQVGGLG